MIYERLFNKLCKIINFNELKSKNNLNFKAKGFMDLNVDYICEEDNGNFRIAIAHNYIQNGDLMCDPDMEIRVYPKLKIAEALTFQQDGHPSIYKVVYTEDGKRFNPVAKKKLNNFLNKWLSNILNQNYKLPKN